MDHPEFFKLDALKTPNAKFLLKTFIASWSHCLSALLFIFDDVNHWQKPVA